MGQRSTKETIEWYQKHETTSQIGFNPDGMCQKVCRTARNIGPGFASALAQQIATPDEFRVHDLNKVRRGMVMYFDDPKDNNPYGHIVTVVGRVKDTDPGRLSSILVRTNSVKPGRLVVVRANFFERYWGDDYQFAGTWINGVELDLPEAKPKPLLGPKGIERLQHIVDTYNRMIENNRGDERIVRALRRDREHIRQTIRLKEKS